MASITADTPRCRYCARPAIWRVDSHEHCDIGSDDPSTLTCDGHLRRGVVLTLLELNADTLTVCPLTVGSYWTGQPEPGYVDQARHLRNTAHARAAEQGTTTADRQYPPLCSRGHDLTEPGARCLQCRGDANNERRAAFGQR